MKIKILAIVVTFILIGSTFIASANIKSKDDVEKNSSDGDNVVNIRVAILTDEEENEEFHSQHGRTRYFIYALKGYSWKVEETTYRFVPTLLSNKRLLKGELTTDNYDVLLPAPDSIWEDAIFTGLRPLKNKIRIQKIVDFIKAGGGYYGSCSAAFVAGDMKNKPDTFFERMWQNGCFKISSVNHELNCALPIVSHFMGKEAGSIGLQGYIEYSGWNTTNLSINYYSGACLDVNISHNNPIFKDFVGPSRRIRWVSGEKLILPDDTDDRITILAKYPSEEISDNKSFRIHHWEYTGGIRGLFKAFIQAIRSGEEIYFLENLGILTEIVVFAEDWKCTDKIVETSHANTPFMVSEIYPNENNARIVLCSGHPEMNVWWGGHIKEVEDNDHNNIYDGFHHWVDVTPENKTVQDEFSYNYWIIKRSVAWASQKVPDDDLPPVYGPSQVCDIHPYEQSSSFVITSNLEVPNSIYSMHLYYRYSPNNISNWSDWIYYGESIDGISWEFYPPAANGSGYYHFCSVRHVDYGDYSEVEKFPPGPDAIARVIE